MHFPDFHLHVAREPKDPQVPQFTTDNGVVMSIVYVTADPTFSGEIGGYTTLNNASPTETDSSGNPQVTDGSVYQTASATDGYYGSSTGYPTATGSSSLDGSGNVSREGGLSGGAKAAIAIAILLILALFIGGVLMSLRKLKKQRAQAAAQDDDEKTAMAGAIPMSSTSKNTKAPRLSLRPVSRIMPEFISAPKNRNSHGNMLHVPDAKNTRTLTPTLEQNTGNHMGRIDEGPHPSNPFNDPQNPFADPEKGMALSGLTTTPASIAAPQSAPVPSATIPPNAPRAIVAGGPGIQQPRQASASLAPTGASGSLVSPESPNLHADPLAAAGPVIAPGPGGQEQPSGNVYRVQMDFKPSMEDELELITGQLVRLLHEYDDGWALCIRLDRSQQGVVPRTCLATKPSKPRPSHLGQYARSGPVATGPMRPPPGADGRNSPVVVGSRPMSPANGPPRTMTPQQAQGPPVTNFNSPRLNNPPPRPGMGTPQRSMSPAVGAPGMSTPQRAMSPTVGRAASPPSSRSRSPAPRAMSPGAFNRAPRPLSPGPRPQPKRSMSPGPYGPPGSGPRPMSDEGQRRRSSSVGAANVAERRGSPPGPSKLGPGNNSTPALVPTPAGPSTSATKPTTTNDSNDTAPTPGLAL